MWLRVVAVKFWIGFKHLSFRLFFGHRQFAEQVVSCCARGGSVRITESKVDIRCDTPTSNVLYYTLGVASRL